MPLPIITTLGERAVADMLSHAQEMNVRARQADAERRVLMMQENWRHLVHSYIDNIYATPAVKLAIKRRVKRTYNVLRQICGRVCVAYKIPPLRTIEGSDEQKKAWSDLMAESRIATKAKTWERYTFATNVVITVPRVRERADGQGKVLDYEMILPDRAEVYTDPNDPMGPPLQVAYAIKDGSDFTGRPLSWVVLDDQAWTTYDHHGRRTGRVEHGAGVFPGTVWRLDDPVDDWWCSHLGDGIVDATIEVAHLAARMDWVRHGQDRRREVFFSTDLNKIPQQVPGAEGPVGIPMAPANARLDILDANTPITNHREHMREYLHQAAESYGIPSVLVDFSLLDDGGVLNVTQHAALKDVRDSHIEWHRQSEHDSAWKTALVLRGMGHPAARMLKPDMVEETFSVQYADLLYVEEPKARLDNSKSRVAQGLSSTFREYHREHPSLTFAQAKAAVLEMAEEEGELNAYYIEHNISRDPETRLKTLAQLQGAQGGEASGEARNEDNTDDDPSKPGRAGPGTPAPDDDPDDAD
ncbi:MAG: hypothetical protein ACRCZP_19920 [Phycicoccus sp.]